MKTPIQTTKMLLLAALMAMSGMYSASAQILHGIPGGDLTGPTGLTTNPIAGTTFAGEGIWNTTSTTANRSTTIVGTGADKHIELWHNWNTVNNVWYTDEGTTPSTNTTWTISTTLTWSGAADAQNALNLYSGNATGLQFQINIIGTTVNWLAGSESGSFTSITGLDLTRRTVSISYNPVTGLATGMLGAETVFSSINAGSARLVKSVLVSSLDSVAPYTAGTLSVYNMSAVPEPNTVAMLGFSLALVMTFRRRTATRIS